MGEVYAPVSVVIPCYKCKDTIWRAIESIRSQSLRPAEVVLVEDRSPDETLNFLREIISKDADWIRLIELDANMGAANARNVGWSHTSQPYLAFLDADDAWHPRKIEIQYRYMEAHPEVDLCGHGHRVSNEDRLPNWLVDTELVQDITKFALLLSNRFVTPSVMLRRSLPFRFVHDQRHMEDHMLWLAIACSNGIVRKLDLELVALYKPSFGVSGLSSHLWLMERGELSNYSRLYSTHCINSIQLCLLVIYSLLKYVRRLIMYWGRYKWMR